MKGAVVYYQPELETMPREELDALQLERLQKLVAYVYERIPFVSRSMKQALNLKTSPRSTICANSRSR